MKLGEICDLCRPVVHLHIDVGGIFAVPRRVQAIGPYTLEIGRLSARLRAAYKEIASELEIKLHKLRVVSGCEILDSDIRSRRSSRS